MTPLSVPLVSSLVAFVLVAAAAAATPAQARASSPSYAAWTPSNPVWIGRGQKRRCRSPLPSIDQHRLPIMTRGGGGGGAASPNPSGPLLGSSAAFELEAGGAAAGTGGGGGVVSVDADGVVLRDGRRLQFGFRPRGWISYLIVWANAVLLTFARKRLLPFKRHWHIKGVSDTSAGGIAVALVFHLLESWVYAQPLLQLQLQLCHRPKLVSAEELAMPEYSRFMEVDVEEDAGGSSRARRIELHALVHKHRQQPAEGEKHYLLHFNHGFGASALSFEPVLATLASSLLVDATAVAHDAPGFGLTLEPERGEDALYGFASNARLGTALVEQVEREERVEPDFCGAEVVPVYVGHSMGALTSSFMALDKLKRMEAAGERDPHVTLILVAPAILSMRESPTRLPPAARRFLGECVPRVARFLWQGLGLHVAVLGTLRYFLRSLAYSKDFWQRGLRLAWGERTGPGDRTLAHYRLPSLKRGWDRSLARFVLAPLMQRAPGERAVGAAQPGSAASDSKLVEELAARVRDGSLRLLLVHGKKDRVVPIPNTRRLYAAMPGAALLELPDVGHVPHEEAPDLFVQQIVDFLLLAEAGEGEGGSDDSNV